MKKMYAVMLLLITAFVVNSAWAMEDGSQKTASEPEITLEGEEWVVDGYCVWDVFELRDSTDRVPFESALPIAFKSFLVRAEKRAAEIYRSYSGVFYELSDWDRLFIESKAVFQQRQDSRALLGAIVDVDMGGDEDLVTFYFSNSYDGHPLLKMAFHSEQSPSAFWVCEY